MSEAEGRRAEELGICPRCKNENPHVREAHFDTVYGQGGPSGLKEHLRKFWSEDVKLIEIKLQTRATRIRYENLKQQTFPLGIERSVPRGDQIEEEAQ